MVPILVSAGSAISALVYNDHFNTILEYNVAAYGLQ